MSYPEPSASSHHDAHTILREVNFSILLADAGMHDEVHQALAGSPLLEDLHHLISLTRELDADLEVLHNSMNEAQHLHDQLTLEASRLRNRQRAMHHLQTGMFLRLGGGDLLAPFDPDANDGNEADVSEDGAGSDSDLSSYYTPPIAQTSPTNSEPIPIPPPPTPTRTTQSEPVPSSDPRPGAATRRVSFTGLPSPVVDIPVTTVSASESAHSDPHSDPPNPYEWYPAGDMPGNPIDVDRLDEEAQPCTRCGRTGHVAEHCPRNWDPSNVPRDVCSQCMQRGHWFRNCLHYRCRNCRRNAPGHASAECPYPPRYSPYPGPSSPPRAGSSSRPY